MNFPIQTGITGIRAVMITGDYPATAAAIAKIINLAPGSGGIISGTELDDSVIWFEGYSCPNNAAGITLHQHYLWNMKQFGQ